MIKNSPSYNGSVVLSSTCFLLYVTQCMRCAGTVVAMETRPGILKESQMSLIEELRDKIQSDFIN